MVSTCGAYPLSLGHEFALRIDLDQYRSRRIRTASSKA
jgi:hypothetical protein